MVLTMTICCNTIAIYLLKKGTLPDLYIVLYYKYYALLLYLMNLVRVVACGGVTPIIYNFRCEMLL